jgi:hypothetical protein
MSRIDKDTLKWFYDAGILSADGGPTSGEPFEKAFEEWNKGQSEIADPFEIQLELRTVEIPVSEYRMLVASKVKLDTLAAFAEMAQTASDYSELVKFKRILTGGGD